MTTPDPTLSIGEVASRTGLSVSAVRFYHDRGLIAAERSEAGHRRFRRSTIRRVSFILVCQRLGYTLDEIGQQLASLPGGRTPSERDWARLAGSFGQDLEQRIAELQQLKDSLAGCIGCGCLSLDKCAMFNPEDRARELGDGPRYLLGNSSDDLTR